MDIFIIRSTLDEHMYNALRSVLKAVHRSAWKYGNVISAFLLSACLISCANSNSLDTHEFDILMTRLADAWSTQDTEAALDCFTADAIYMQPPEEQFFRGHDQLRPFFGALKSGTFMKFHHLWFDAETQSGAGEFTFGNTVTGNGVTGVTIVTLERGKISAWREYFIKGPINFEEFISTDAKDWKWHIGHYR